MTSVPCLPMPTNTDVLLWIAAGGGTVATVDTTVPAIIGATVAANGTCSAPITLAPLGTPSFPVAVTALAVDGAQFFYATSAGVYACSTASGCGSTPTTLAANPGTVSSLAVDARNVYWVGSSGGSTGLVACARSGCGGFPTAIVPSATPTAGSTVDATSVYYMQGGTLFREAKL